MVRFGKRKEEPQVSMTEDDIEKIVDELRHVLEKAATLSEADRKVILDLTKTIEDLTERRVDKMRQWDPAYGEVETSSVSSRKEAILRHLEEAERKLPEKTGVRNEKKTILEEEDKTLQGTLQSFIRRLSGSD